jgi:hypothetical protein
MIDNILMDPFDRCGFGNLNIEAQVAPPSALSPLKTQSEGILKDFIQ